MTDDDKPPFVHRGPTPEAKPIPNARPGDLVDDVPLAGGGPAAKPAHPPPWRWVQKKMGNWSDDDERAADRLVLVDANGDYIIDTDGDDYSWVTVETPYVRAVTELAPEMEVALRAAVDMVHWLAPFASAFAPPGSNLPTALPEKTRAPPNSRAARGILGQRAAEAGYLDVSLSGCIVANHDDSGGVPDG